MALTDLNTSNIQYMIQKYWSSMFMDELRANAILPSLVNSEYSGEIKRLGDQVTVSQINAIAADLLTVGTDADTFDSTALSTSYVQVKADKRIVASVEIAELVELQSQIGAAQSQIRDMLSWSISDRLNTYLLSLISPSSTTPDHVVSGVTDLNASQLAGVRLLAATAKWAQNKPWYGIVSPSYYSDLLNATTLSSSDYGATDAPVINGKIGLKRFGFTLFEDATLGTDVAYFFHPDFMLLCMQKEPTFKLSDLHSNKKFGYLLSVDMILGAKQGINGDVKVIKVYNS